MNTMLNSTSVTVRQRSWLEAYRMFLMNPREPLGIKLLPLAVLGLVPLSIADDFLIPFLGVADNIPTSLLVLFTAFQTWRRVRPYR